MYLCFLFCIILFIPYLYGNSLSTPIADSNSKSTNKAIESPLKLPLNDTKMPLITEGGSFEPEAPIATLPKESHSNLINLDKEIGKSKIKSVVPRKGVKYPTEDNVTQSNSTKDGADTTVLEPKIVEAKPITAAKEPPQVKSSVQTHLTGNINKTTNNVTRPLPNDQTHISKKPLLVSAQAIAETDKKVALEKAKLGTSSKPEHSQLPSPKVKYEKLSSSSDPVVIPVVITILLVPMFAVLGYLALRRGQEAWKNRHYKRMDFLLDGMYKD